VIAGGTGNQESRGAGFGGMRPAYGRVKLRAANGGFGLTVAEAAAFEKDGKFLKSQDFFLDRRGGVL